VKIILNEDVYNLGEEGDVCEVARGYARNFLLPQGHAVVFNRQNQSIFEHKKDAIKKRKEIKRNEALGLKQKLEDLKITVKMPAGETGKLFGSVNNSVIAEALEKEGISIEKKKIDVASSSIKNIGTYTVLIKLYSGDSANIEVTVASVDGKAEAALAKKQEAAKAKSLRAKPVKEAVAAVEEAATETEAEEEVEAEAEEQIATEEEQAEEGPDKESGE
jgi:large subunit ribosomal protein L9